MLTTLVGGDVFEYQDANSNFIRVKVTGDAIIELIAGEVDVSLESQPIILGDMPGQFVSSNAGKGGSSLLGGVGGVDGVELVTDDQPVFGVVPPNPISITNPSGFSGVVTSPGAGVTLSGLAANAAGVTYAFNSGNSSASGQDTLVVLDNNSAQGTQVATVEGATLRDDVLSTLTQSLTQVNAVAVDPTNGDVYAVSEQAVSRLFRITASTGVTTFVGNLTNTSSGRPLVGVKAMAFNNAGQLFIAANDFDGDLASDASLVGTIVNNVSTFSPVDPGIVRVDKVTGTFSNANVSPLVDAAGTADRIADYRALTIDPASGTMFGTSATTTNNITTYTLFSLAQPAQGARVQAPVIGGAGSDIGTIEGLAFSVDVNGNRILVGLDKSLTDANGVILPRLVSIGTNNASITEISNPGTIGLARTDDSINDIASYTTPGDTRPFLYGVSNSGDGVTRVIRGSTISIPYISGDGPVVSAADFRPATGGATDGQLYFVSTGDNSQLFRMRTDLVGQAAIQNSIVAIPGHFGDTATNITGLVWDQTSDTSARLIAYDATTGALGLVNPDDTGDAGNEFTSQVSLRDQRVADITGIEFAPDNTTAAEEFLYVTSGTGPNAQLLRVRLDNIGSTFDSRALQFGPLSDPDDKAPFTNDLNVRGEHIGDVTWNASVLNPFTRELGVLLGTDISSDELIYIDTRNRFPSSDAFSIYISQASADSSIVIGQIPYASNTNGQAEAIPDMEPFTGDSGPIRVFDTFGDQTITFAPGNAGAVYLGAKKEFDIDSTSTINEQYIPITTGTLLTSVGVRPARLDDLPDDPATISAGIQSGTTLLEYVSKSTDFGQRMLGQNLDLIKAMAISRSGTIVAVDSDGKGTNGQNISGTPDQIAVINGSTGRAQTPVNVFDSSTGLPLRDIAALSWGDPNFGANGGQRLYGIYTINNNVTLGLLNETSGAFTPSVTIAALANVRAMAFSPGAGSVPGKQGLYAIADPDGDGIDTLFELTYTVDFQGIINHISAALSIGPLVDESNFPIDVGGMDFDSSNNTARLLISDRARGRLLDLAYNVAQPTGTLTIGENTRTADGSLRATVSAIAYDYPNRRMLAIDTATGAPDLLDESTTESDMLMIITGTSTASARGQTIDRVFVDGTVTGAVNLSGSVETFYAGWIITGDTEGQPDGSDPLVANNFYVAGDLRNLVVLTSIGSDTIVGAFPDYLSGFDLLVGGKLGQTNVIGGIYGSFRVEDSLVVNSDDLPLVQDEVESRVVTPLDDSAGLHFEGVTTPRPTLWGETFSTYDWDPPVFQFRPFENLRPGAFNAFENDTFTTAQFVGSIRPPAGSIGENDTIRISGTLQNTFGNDVIDYYAVALMAGVPVTFQLDTLGDSTSILRMGIFDPDGNLIQTNYSDLESDTIRDLPITFTPDRPGSYRVAIGMLGDTAFEGNRTFVELRDLAYQIHATNVGDLAIGGITAGYDFFTHQTKSAVDVVRGDLGAIYLGGNFNHEQVAFDDPADVLVSDGNLRAIQAINIASTTITSEVVVPPVNRLLTFELGIGVGIVSSPLGPNLSVSVLDYDLAPNISVPQGSVGLIRTFDVMAFNVLPGTQAIGGDYQFIDAGGDFYANVRANRAIGSIRVGGDISGAPDFDVNVDGEDNDGVIDMIDVVGDMGAPDTGGPHITTGPGGNVRYIFVAGAVWQDSLFARAEAGEVDVAPGTSMPFFDDSGASIMIASTVDVEATADSENEAAADDTGATTATTVFGTLTLRYYGIRGSGGSVLITATSSTGVSITGNSSGNQGPVEVSRIVSHGIGAQVERIGEVVTVVDGKDVVTPAINNGLGYLQLTQTVDPDTGKTTFTEINNVNISASDGTTVDVGEIRGSFFNNIVNNTGGEIARIEANSVGAIFVKGSIGDPKHATGAVPIPSLVNTPDPELDNELASLDALLIDSVARGKSYPVSYLRTGIFAANDIVSINAYGSIGNIVVGGSIGTLNANSDHVDDADMFEGIVAPVITGYLPTFNVNGGDIISTNIGEGIASTGAGEVGHGGLFVAGTIGVITNQGEGSDIRGNVVASGFFPFGFDGEGKSTSVDNPDALPPPALGNINLTDGSIIDANIVSGDFTASSDLYGVGGSGEVGSIRLNGIGGMIGVEVAGSSIGNTTIIGGGFGLVNSHYFVEGSLGEIGNTIADGYGIRNVDFTGGLNMGDLIATGDGDVLDPSDYTFAIRAEGIATPVNDLQTFLDAHSLRNLDTTVIEGSRRSGLIDNVHANGSTNLGQVVAFQITASEVRRGADPDNFFFANSIKGIRTLDIISDLNIVTGDLGVFSPGFDVIALNMVVAGSIKAINITGDLRGNSQITTNGPNGNIGSITISPKEDRKGSLIGHIDANGRIGDVNIAGDLIGGISVQALTPGNQGLKSLTLGGDFVGTLDINGDVGFIQTAHDFGDVADGSTVRINGSLDDLRVGVPNKKGKAVLGRGGSLGVSLTVLGEVRSITVYGSVDGDVFIHGGLETFYLSADPFTADHPILNGDVAILGPVKSMSVIGGQITSQFIAAQTISQVTITNAAITSTGEITSSLGSIGKVTVTSGSLGGSFSAPNGNIDTITINNADLSADIVARNVKSISIDGSILAGAIIDVLGTLGGLTVGVDVQDGASVTAGNLPRVSVGRDLLGDISIGHVAAGVSISVRRDLGGDIDIASDANISAGGSVIAGTSVYVGGSLSFTAKGPATGDFIVDGSIDHFSSLTLNNAVIVAGFNIGSVDVSGSITNTLIQAGASAGDDHVFASNGGEDFGEDVRLGNIDRISADMVSASVFAAGGAFDSLVIDGDMTDSSASSGLVIGSHAIATIMSDAIPLSSPGELAAAVSGNDRELFHGDFGLASVGAFVNSDISAGVDAGADGIFGTGDDSVLRVVNGIPSGGGSSAIGTIRGTADAASAFVADSGIGNASAGGIVNANVNYSINQLTTHHALPTRVDTATASNSVQYHLLGNITVTIVVSGPGSVEIYDQGGTDSDGTIDTLVLVGTSKSTKVTVTGGGKIGRILSADDATVGQFTYDGNLVGDTTVDPDLWIDGGLDLLSINAIGDAVTGQVGGDVKTLNIGTQGAASIHIAGDVSALNISAGNGDPLLQRLGTFSTRTFNAVTVNSVGSVYVHQNGVIYRVNPNINGSISQTIPVFDGSSNATISLQGMDFDASNTLYGVGVVSSFSPTQLLGNIVSQSTIASLSALTISPTGRIFAIQHVDSNGDTATDFDTLVELNSVTGALSTIGRIRDIFLNDFVNNFVQLAFAPDGTLYGISNDLDGSGGSYGVDAIDSNSLNGYGAALFRISTTAIGGVVTATSPTSAFATGVLLDGGAMTNRFVAMAVDGNGQVWAVRRNFADDGDELVSISASGAVTPSGGAIGSIFLDTDGDGVGDSATRIKGIGFDANGNIIALNNLGDSSQLITLSNLFIDNPTRFATLTAPGSLDATLDAFGVSFGTGNNRSSFAYDFDNAVGGQVFRSSGSVVTLGTVAVTGASAGKFTQIRGISQDTNGTPLSGGVHALTIDSADSGDVFVLSGDGLLYRYDPTSGALLDNYPVAFTQSDSGKAASISTLAFDDVTGDLIGIDSQFNRVVIINKDTGVVRPLTQSGTALEDLTNLAFDSSTDKFISFETDSHRFVRLVGTTQAELNGITANSVGNLNISGDGSFSSRIATSGGGFGSITLGETFTGSIFSTTDIGSINFKGAVGKVYGGAIQSLGDIGSASIQNVDVLPGGIVDARGVLGKFDHKGGTFDGVLQSLSAGTVGIAGEVGPDSSFLFTGDVGSVSFGAQFRGQFTAGSSSKAFNIKGIAGSGSDIFITNDVKSLSIGGGVATNASTHIDGSLGALNIGGTFSGTFASRLGLGKGTLGDASGGIFTVGLDSTSLSVKNATRTVFDFGVWIGADGIFNTADDVITGGSIGTVAINGNFTDSVLAGGVLPTTVHGAFVAGVSDNRYFTGNSSSTILSDVDSAQAGGALKSSIGKFTVSGSVVSSSPSTGKVSAVVSADGVKSQTIRSFASALVSRTYPDAYGAPTVTSVKRINSIETDIFFSEPVDSSSIVLAIDANNNGSVDDPADTPGTVLLVDNDGNVVDDVVLRYSTVTSTEGVQTGVLRLVRSTGIPDLQVTLFGEPLTGRAITDRSGLRSVLRDFNQDGAKVTSEDRPQTTLDGNNDGVEGGDYTAILVSTASSSPFTNVNTVTVLSPILNGPAVTAPGTITTNTDADVYRFTGGAGQFVSLEFNGQPSVVVALFYQDNQGTTTLADDTYEVVACYANSGFNGSTWQGFELPNSGNYFAVVAQDPFAFFAPFLANTYTLQVTLADTAAGLDAPSGSTIAFVNNVDNTPKQLVYLDFTGDTSTLFTPTFGAEVAMSAFNPIDFDSSLGAFTQAFIHGDTNVTSIVDNVIAIYRNTPASNPLGQLNVQLVSNGDYSAYNAATEGIFFTTTPPPSSVGPYTTLFLGKTSSTASDGLLGIADEVDIANMHKQNEALIFVDNFRGYSTAGTTIERANEYSLAIANAAAHELGHTLGLNHQPTQGTGFNLVADDPDNTNTTPSDANRGPGLMAYPSLALLLSTRWQLGTANVTTNEFPLGQEDTVDLLLHWLK